MQTNVAQWWLLCQHFLYVCDGVSYVDNSHSWQLSYVDDEIIVMALTALVSALSAVSFPV